MDDVMQDSTPIRPTHSRKRSVWDLEEEDDTVNTLHSAIDLQETPAKRLQNSQGEAIKRQPIKYNAQKLLCNLAFTRFYVTENFANYDPRSSFIILCMVAEQNELYRAVW